MSGYSIQEIINRNEQDVERESGRTLSDKDLLMEELRNLQEGRTLSDRDMVPRMQGGGQPQPMPPIPPMSQQPPPPVPAVGGGLPSVADNMRNAMPPAKPPPPMPPAESPEQMAGMPSMTPEVEQAIAQTIEVSETPEEILTNAMASTVVSVAESPEEIISTFETAKEQALMQYAQITGSPDAGMSETDARLMELLGGGDEMMMSEEVMI